MSTNDRRPCPSLNAAKLSTRAALEATTKSETQIPSLSDVEFTARWNAQGTVWPSTQPLPKP